MKNRFSRLFVFSALLILIVFWLVGFLVFGGRSPRTGEYFKDTKNCEISPIWIFMIQGKSIPLGERVFLAPIGNVGALVELMVNHVWDCVMMPVDMAKEFHGFYVRVVDLSGNPVSGAKVKVVGYGGGLKAKREDVGKTDSAGMLCVRRLGYLLSYVEIDVPGFVKVKKRVCCQRDEHGDLLRGPGWKRDTCGKVYTIQLTPK